MFIMSDAYEPRIAVPVKNIIRIFLNRVHENIFEVVAEIKDDDYFLLGEFQTWEEGDMYLHAVCHNINLGREMFIISDNCFPRLALALTTIKKIYIDKIGEDTFWVEATTSATKPYTLGVFPTDEKADKYLQSVCLKINQGELE